MDSEKILENLRNKIFSISEQRGGRSSIWETLKRIEHNGIIIKNYVYCSRCSSVLRYDSSQRNKLVRHPCCQATSYPKFANFASDTTLIKARWETWAQEQNIPLAVFNEPAYKAMVTDTLLLGNKYGPRLVAATVFPTDTQLEEQPPPSSSPSESQQAQSPPSSSPSESQQAQSPSSPSPSEQQRSGTPQTYTDEGSSYKNRESLMDKVKLHVSSIIPDSLSKWFSPVSESDAGHSEQSPSQERQQQERDNGSATTSILPSMSDDAHRREYNARLLRSRQMAHRDNDEANAEDEDDEPADDVATTNRTSNRSSRHRHSSSSSSSSNAAQPQRKCNHLQQQPAEAATSTFCPQYDAFQSDPQLHASTPADNEAVRSRAPPNRFSAYVNLYAHQRVREPAYNLLANSAGNEAAVATSGDLPMSARRSLNIAQVTESLDTTLPSYRRHSLSQMNSLSQRNSVHPFPPISEVNYDQQQQHQPDEQQQQAAARQEANNSNNNNINNARRGGINAATGTDSHSECESNESNAVGGFGGNASLGYGLSGIPMHNNNLPSVCGNSLNRKSLYNANITAPSYHNSTLTLNSPFYQGPTAFGGSSANNRYFSQGNLANNSGGSSPAPSNNDTTPFNSRLINNYGRKSVDIRPQNVGDGNQLNPPISQRTQRIFSLLENHTTPLMDAKKLGNTLREHQQQRNSRQHHGKPYAYQPGFNKSNKNSRDVADQDDGNQASLLVPTMLELLELRRLHRTRPSTQSSDNNQSISDPEVLKKLTEQKELQQEEHQQAVNLATTTSNVNYTNKIRSRLSHQTRKDSRNVENELSLPPLDLPHLIFPEMTNEPKFDLIITPLKQKPTAAASVAATNASSTSITVAAAAKTTPASIVDNVSKISSSSSNNNNNNINAHIPETNNFKFDAPLKLKGIKASKTTPHPQLGRTFEFDSPTSLDGKQKPSQNQLKSASYSLNGASNSLISGGSVLSAIFPKPTDNVATLAAAPPPPSAAPAPESVAVAVTPPAMKLSSGFGFGSQFKKSSSEWECDACMVRNKEEASKCIACDTSKPKAKIATTTIAGDD